MEDKKLTNCEIALFSIILFAIDFVLTGFVAVYLWNNIISVIFNVTTLTFWQVWGLSMCRHLFLPFNNYKKIESKDEIPLRFLGDIIVTLLILLVAFLIITFVGF